MKTLGALLLLALWVSESRANVGEAYGFGSRSGALAGAGAAQAGDGFAAYSNPAALPLMGGKRLSLGWGLVLMEPSFLSIDNVVVENNYVSDKSPPRTGSVDLDYRRTLGQAIGLAYVLSPNRPNLTFGLVTFFPLEALAYIDTGEVFVPEFVHYRARTQRPQVEAAIGGRVSDRLTFGAGVHIAYTLTSSATIFLQTNPSKPSTMRFLASMKPKAGVFGGFLLRSDTSLGTGAFSAFDPSPPGAWSLGGNFRTAVASSNHVTVNSAARAFGSFAAVDFNFTAISAVYYDPWSFELGWVFQYAERSRLTLQADAQLWSKFEPPALSIADPRSCQQTSCGVNISPSSNPAIRFRDIIVPRVGHEWLIPETGLGDLAVRAGYGFRPSTVAGPFDGAGNLLDPAKHMITAGAGMRFKSFLSFDIPSVIDVHLAYHRLLTQTVAKLPGDETGAGTGNEKIGAPGYLAGGKVYGGGVSLTLNF